MIMETYQKHCQPNEGEPEALKGAFELAAIYVIHGEYNDMREQMLQARGMAKSKSCQASIDDFLD